MSIRFLSAGESHGPALIGIIEGLPAGIDIDQNDLNLYMKARKLGYGRGSRQKIENDQVEILSGVRFAKTLGTPISIMISNRDFSNWSDTMSVWGEPNTKKQVRVPRPGHADAVGAIKYGYHDLRNSLERASARETAVRVALGYFAQTFLKSLGIEIKSRVISIGHITDEKKYSSSLFWESKHCKDHDLRVLDSESSQMMKQAIERARQDGNTLGGSLEVRVKNLPIGIGSYSQWDKKIEAKIGASLLSLNAMKAVEIGMGAESAKKLGSEVHDPMLWDEKNGLEFTSNKAGGMLAGVSTGSDLIATVHMKPIATLMKPMQSFDWQSKKSIEAHVERSDYCAVPAASVIAQSLMALDITDLILDKFGGDSLDEIIPRVNSWSEMCKS